MLSSSLRRATSAIRPQIVMRSFAQGPASGGEISDAMLDKLGSLSTQALVDGLWVMGWPAAQIDAARPLTPKMKCCGRAVTLNFVPARPDIAQDKPAGGNSPEYEAFELCGPKEVGFRFHQFGEEVVLQLFSNRVDPLMCRSLLCPVLAHMRVLEETSNSFA
jgi:hypothetical protein